MLRLAASSILRGSRSLAGGAFLPRAEVESRVLSVVRGFEKVDSARVTPGAHFIKDLGLDSLDTVEVVLAMEEEFALEIPDQEAERIQTVADAVEFIATSPFSK
eukprot:TRINITY_DN420_c0_g1_i1.p2 TRINITY_DN420_c0_g1~~TRINITY_DN420_c0_g1_i1.p2  ORF type:complete len:104 (-),score=41.57 TRINITY_DN420_c0_g1_i1:107-418(-)